uniref:Uncharacterized protein n=1 Tax=Anopheles maculatus TaxID=74869 RepID=A0A182SPK5_9DIPT
METLSKIIVKKYFPGFECFQARDRLTDDEYQIVKRCTLDDLLQTESNPTGLEQICEGEKVQTAEYYKQKEKNFERNLARLYRKPPKSPRQRRVITTVVPSTNENHTAANDQSAAQIQHLSHGEIQPPTHLILTEELQEPTRSNEAHQPQPDPYQLPEKIAPLASIQPPAMLPEDDNFGSQDVDGARDFLQLCTGEELPPMSLRESLTRNMLIAQFPSIAKDIPIVDNFQELDLRGINTPMFKRPLQTSTPLVASVEQVAQLPLPALEELIPAQETIGQQQDQTIEMLPNAAVEAVWTTAKVHPLGDSAEQRNLEVAQISAQENNSSTEHSEITAPLPRHIRREVEFTARLEPFPINVPKPKQRRNFDIFSFPCPVIWNKTIQDIQTELAERWKRQQPLCEVPTPREALTEQRIMDSGFQQQLLEVPILREALTDQRIDSGFQQTVDEVSRHVPPVNVTETSNLLANFPMDTEVPSKHDPILTSDLIASIQPTDLEQPGSIDGKLVEVSDRFILMPTSTEATFVSQENTLVAKIPPMVEHVPILQDASKNTVVKPVIVTESHQQKKCSRSHRDKKKVEDEIDPIADLSSILFNQAKEFDTTPEVGKHVEATATLDATIVDILHVVQGEMCNTDNESISMERLQQLLHISSALVAAKTFKNIILLKTAGLLDIETNSELHITHVSVKLPQVDDLDIS